MNRKIQIYSKSLAQAPVGTVVRTRSELWNLKGKKIGYGQSLYTKDKGNPNIDEQSSKCY